MSKPDYDTTVARIAGNIAAGLVPPVAVPHQDLPAIADTAVALARAIVARVRETDPHERSIAELEARHDALTRGTDDVSRA